MKNFNFKSTCKLILSKIPVFLFCVLFISMHNKFFGIENSIVGVTMLLGLFMSFGSDLGFKLNQACIAMLFLFFLMVSAPTLSLINPYIGLLINFISLFFILTVSGNNIKASNHLTFMMGYLFCQGYTVHGEIYHKRLLSVFIFAIIITFIYFFMNRKKTYTMNFTDLFKNMSLRNENTRWHLELASLLTIVMFVGSILNYPRTMWITLSVLSIIVPLNEEHDMRKRHRIPATILGTLLFFALYEMLIPKEYQAISTMTAGFLSMFITSYFIKTVYNSFSALITAALIFPVKEAMLLRVVSNIVGVLIAIIYHEIFKTIFIKYTVKSQSNSTI